MFRIMYDNILHCLFVVKHAANMNYFSEFTYSLSFLTDMQSFAQSRFTESNLYLYSHL